MPVTADQDFAAYWPHEPADGRPQEDAAIVVGSTLAVADGVTRDRLRDGAYPDPSPAAAAAHLFCSAVHACAGNSAHGVFAEGNRRIAEYNESSGLARTPDVVEHDLAGTVSALAHVVGGIVRWAYIGDAGVAVIATDGCIVAETPDDVGVARCHFPTGVTPQQSRAIIRGRLRNHPGHILGSYGVLTGEPDAMAYVRYGSWTLTRSAACLVFTDGFRPLLHRVGVRRAVVEALAGDGCHSDVVAACGLVRGQAHRTVLDEATVVARWMPLAA